MREEKKKERAAKEGLGGKTGENREMGNSVPGLGGALCPGIIKGNGPKRGHQRKKIRRGFHDPRGGWPSSSRGQE